MATSSKGPNHSRYDLVRAFFRKKPSTDSSLRELFEEQGDLLREIGRFLEDQKTAGPATESVDSNATSTYPTSTYDSVSTQTDFAIEPTDRPSEAPADIRADYRSISTQTDVEVANHPPLADRTVRTAQSSLQTTLQRPIFGFSMGQSIQFCTSEVSNSTMPFDFHGFSDTGATKVGGKMPDASSLDEPRVIRGEDRIKVPWKGGYIVVRLPPFS